MLFNGDYFDIILFCIMAVLLFMTLINHKNIFRKLTAKAVFYLKKYIKKLCFKVKNQKPFTVILNLSVQIIISVFLSFKYLPASNIFEASSIVFITFLKVFGIYLLLLAITNAYFSFISSYLKIEIWDRRILTLLTLIIIVIMEKHMTNSIFTLSIFTIIIAFYYIINVIALLKTVGMARCKNTNVKTIWRGVVGIMGMFILLFSVLYYEINATLPNAFNKPISWIDSVYFTLITFATIGFGDISPANNFTKLVTIINALTSIACLVFLVNAIMSLTSEAAKNNNND